MKFNLKILYLEMIISYGNSGCSYVPDVTSPSTTLTLIGSLSATCSVGYHSLPVGNTTNRALRSPGVGCSPTVWWMIVRPLADLGEIAVVGGFSFFDPNAVHRRPLPNEEQPNIAFPIPVDRLLPGMLNLGQYFSDRPLPRH